MSRDQRRSEIAQRTLNIAMNFMHVERPLPISFPGITRAGLALCLTACASLGTTSRTPLKLTLPSSVADTVTSEPIAPGVQLHHLVWTTTPLRAHVLDVDLQTCISIRAVKGGPTAVGRTTTSALLQALPPSAHPLAAVNADFFSFTPPGVPVGAQIEEGRLISGPITRPVLAFDMQNHPYIGALTIKSELIGAHSRFTLTTWNRPTRTASGIVDAAWAQPLDTAMRSTATLLAPIAGPQDAVMARYIVVPLPPSHTGVAIGDTLIVFGVHADSIVAGDTVSVRRTWSPITPFNAVGGFPLLVQDSAIVASIDTDGAEGFRGVNPRTVAGYAASGRRLFLVVIDGRQPGISVGTTTRATAELMRSLGAVHAVNLDGGGSTAMVLRDAGTGSTRLVNTPSDAAGERPVANALAVLGTCALRRELPAP
jgi:Phosphodiester glycosidase